jgi:hypothetical protein
MTSSRTNEVDAAWHQEGRAERLTAALRRLAALRVRVLRGGGEANRGRP